MKKRLLHLFLVFLCVLCFSGCESSSTSSTSEFKEITAENYGDKYDYSVTVNDVVVDDWKIFYKDEDGIYIIPSTYLPMESVGEKDAENSISSKTHVSAMGEYYGIYYSTSKLVYQEPNENIQTKYLKLLSLDPDHGSNVLVSEMLHSENWSSLVNTDMGASYAIGGVPLEMFVASWNEKYPEEKIYIDVEEQGYTIGLEESPTTYQVDLSSLAGYQDKLYFPTQDVIEESSVGEVSFRVTGYMLAAPSWCGSPSYGKCSTLEYLHENSGIIRSKAYGGYGYALRPIVFIPNKS